MYGGNVYRYAGGKLLAVEERLVGLLIVFVVDDNDGCSRCDTALFPGVWVRLLVPAAVVPNGVPALLQGFDNVFDLGTVFAATGVGIVRDVYTVRGYTGMG